MDVKPFATNDTEHLRNDRYSLQESFRCNKNSNVYVQKTITSPFQLPDLFQNVAELRTLFVRNVEHPSIELSPYIISESNSAADSGYSEDDSDIASDSSSCEESELQPSPQNQKKYFRLVTDKITSDVWLIENSAFKEVVKSWDNDQLAEAGRHFTDKASSKKIQAYYQVVVKRLKEKNTVDVYWLFNTFEPIKKSNFYNHVLWINAGRKASELILTDSIDQYYLCKIMEPIVHSGFLDGHQVSAQLTTSSKLII